MKMCKKWVTPTLYVLKHGLHSKNLLIEESLITFVYVYYEDESSVLKKVFLCPLIVKSALRWVTEAYIAHVV